MVLLVAFGLLPMLHASLLAAGLMLITRCTRGASARRQVDWSVLVTIAAAFGVGRALEVSGLAQGAADTLTLLAGTNVTASLALLYLATALFSALVTNNAAAVLMFPVALGMAASLGADPLPFAITIAMAASASFATPIGYQTNLMVYGPGGYRFTDFLRIGLPLTLLTGALTVLLVPQVWHP
jgi:di/tricarboxylate transporter